LDGCLKCKLYSLEVHHVRKTDRVAKRQRGGDIEEEVRAIIRRDRGRGGAGKLVSDPSLSAGSMFPGYDQCSLHEPPMRLSKMVAETNFCLVPIEIHQIERARSVDDMTRQLDVPGQSHPPTFREFGVERRTREQRSARKALAKAIVGGSVPLCCGKYITAKFL
jgi:hypothetical protein